MGIHHSAKNASSKQTILYTPIKLYIKLLGIVRYTLRNMYHNSIKFGLPQTKKLLCKLKVKKYFKWHLNFIVNDPAVEYTFQVTKLIELKY